MLLDLRLPEASKLMLRQALRADGASRGDEIEGAVPSLERVEAGSSISADSSRSVASFSTSFMRETSDCIAVTR